MINLGSWMNGILIGWGVDPKIANTFDEMIIAALLVILAIGLDYLCQAIFVGSMKKLAQHTHYQWDSLLLKRKVVHHLVHTIPGILVYALLPLAFIRGKGLLLLSQKICAVYIVFALLLAINGFILVFLDMYNMRQVNKNRPIKGFMQVLQVLLFFIGGIVIIAILIGKSPASLFGRIGCFGSNPDVGIQGYDFRIRGGHTAFRQRYASAGRLDHGSWFKRERYRTGNYTEHSQDSEFR